MKRYVLLLLSVCACSTYHLRQKEKKERLLNPPGTVRIKDNLYIDKYEVSNISWREFLAWIDQRDTAHRYKKDEYLTDTLIWDDLSSPDLSQYYHTHPSFNDYPLVGVSCEQALAFCKWRTELVNELIAKREHPEWKFKKVAYRLPTREEWELAASNGLDPDQYPYGLKMPAEEIDDKIYYHWPRYDSPGFEKRIYTIPVRSLYPSSFSTYHMLGNVSEMIAEKGIAKGGNFNLRLDSCKIKLDHPYTKPEAWLGFRCVCEIIE